MNEVLALAFIVIVGLAFIRGLAIAFGKSFWLAVLMLICFFPLLIVWALVEGFFNWR